ncbi:hypothetical protein ACFX2H_026400 [Malus domestica]
MTVPANPVLKIVFNARVHVVMHAVSKDIGLTNVPKVAELAHNSPLLAKLTLGTGPFQLAAYGGVIHYQSNTTLYPRAVNC